MKYRDDEVMGEEQQRKRNVGVRGKDGRMNDRKRVRRKNDA